MERSRFEWSREERKKSKWLKQWNTETEKSNEHELEKRTVKSELWSVNLKKWSGDCEASDETVSQWNVPLKIVV